MDRYEYEGLISRLEAQANYTPDRFRNKVVLFSALAYAAVFSLLVGGIVLILCLLVWAFESSHTFTAVKLGIFGLTLVPVIYVVGRTFLTPLNPPDGRPVTRDEAPQLFSTLSKMRKRLRGPAIHHVLIDGRFNAAIMQRPRWGLFGRHTNYLILGLPYLLGVPPKEVLATIAHEYGHLCGNHGKVSAWVYRQRRTFDAMYEKVQQGADGNWAHAAMAALLRKCMPYYDAYTFVLSRQNEYEADFTATELVGAEINAQGLVRDTLLGEWIHEQFWPKLYALADKLPAPTFKPFSSMRVAFAAAYDEWATQERLALALRRDADLLDTHPSLRERVEATGLSAALPPRLDRSAAEALLGPLTKTLIDEFDKVWWTKERTNWELRFQHTARSKARLAQLTARKITDLPPHELQELALLKADLVSHAAAKPILKFLLRQPGGPYPKAMYLYGRILLAEQNEEGLQRLADAATVDRSLLDDAGRHGYAYLLQHQGEQIALHWWEGLRVRQQAAAA